jgi:uncharacterized membrane protein YedE/YeeE
MPLERSGLGLSPDHVPPSSSQSQGRTTTSVDPPAILPQWRLALGGLAVWLAGALWLGADNWRFGALFLIGGGLGLGLYHAAFGFTAAYRRAMVERDIAGVTAQLLMLGLAMVLFTPLLASEEIFGRSYGGNVAPVALRVVVGSFLFGFGMQLGNGCGSGTLFTLGGGSSRMAVTLLFFCAGSFLGSLDIDRWEGDPSLGAISLLRELGWPAALLIQGGLLFLVWQALRRWAGDVPQKPIWGEGLSWQHLLHGPWPLLFSAGLLAVLNALTLVVAGHPWSVTSAFALWGAKAAVIVGWDPASATYWAGPWRQAALERSVFQDTISITNFGIMLGALIAAGLAGRFAPTLTIPPRSLLAAIIGGLLMGYGARLAFGCNIGAFFSGFASFSLHAWVWILGALAGSWLAIRFRPWFGLANP